jgi:hypothetical protein
MMMSYPGVRLPVCGKKSESATYPRKRYGYFLLKLTESVELALENERMTTKDPLHTYVPRILPLFKNKQIICQNLTRLFQRILLYQVCSKRLFCKEIRQYSSEKFTLGESAFYDNLKLNH